MHPLQEKIYQIYKENNNKLPSFRKLARMIGLASAGAVAYHINELKKQGYFSPENFQSGLIKLTLKNLVHLESKSGVYVLVKNKSPFYVEETEDIKKNILEKILDKESKILKNTEEEIEEIEIAYHFIDDKNEREEMKKHLMEYYPKKGINLILE